MADDRDRPNAVAEIAIWRESIRKEQKHAAVPTEFSIPHPERMQGITEKPTRVDPRKAVDLARTQESQKFLADLSQVGSQTIPPPQKFRAPMTTSQEYGWVSEELLEKNKMFSYTKTQCDVTNYADNFYEMTGRSPYANPAGNAN